LIFVAVQANKSYQKDKKEGKIDEQQDRKDMNIW
jgi:hypothetical protein